MKKDILKTPEAWLRTKEFRGILVSDPAGWTSPDGLSICPIPSSKKSWDEPITRYEFIARMCRSSLINKG
jgi:hypothetical protein